MTQKSLISIIVPVYKVEKYLKKCVDSILNQTYKNIEVILVDDGSPDKCPQLCDEYKASDSRVIVIHKENAGLSAARNTGIENAHGEFLAFIDSDDWVASDFVEILYNRIKKDNSDIAICNFNRISESGAFVDNFKQIAPEEKSILNFNEFWETSEKHAAVSIVAWNKLYKKEIFSDIRFFEGHIHEDVFIMPHIMDRVSLISQETSALYYYLKREDSIVGALSRKNCFDSDAFLANSETCLYLSKHKLYKLCARKMMNAIVDSTIRYKKSKITKTETKLFFLAREKLKNVYKTNKIEFIEESKKFNICMKLFYFNVSLFYFAYSTLQILKRIKHING